MFGFMQLFEAFLFRILSISVKNVRGRGVLTPIPTQPVTELVCELQKKNISLGSSLKILTKPKIFL
jgi:hypothetical protein